VFKARLDGAWSSLVQWKVSLPMAGGLELGDLKSPFQPQSFYDSVLLYRSNVVNAQTMSSKTLGFGDSAHWQKSPNHQRSPQQDFQISQCSVLAEHSFCRSAAAFCAGAAVVAVTLSL